MTSFIYHNTSGQMLLLKKYQFGDCCMSSKNIMILLLIISQLTATLPIRVRAGTKNSRPIRFLR